MKANEAPEKIYLQDSMSTDIVGELWPEWFDAKVSDYSIEYTRTDAFIEKAKKWFEECFMNVHRWEISTYEFENIQSMIDEFRKYMEGE